MCILCDISGISSAPQAEVTTRYTVATDVVEKLVETVEESVRLGIASVKVSEREDGPAESFIALTGPADELTEIHLALLITGFPAKLVPEIAGEATPPN